MKNKPNFQSAFVDPRVFVSFLLLFGGSLLAITGFGISAEGQATKPTPAAIMEPLPLASPIWCRW